MSVGLDLKRFQNFKDAEFRSIEILSPTDIKLTFGIQDASREFDWITLVLEFSGVCEAKLVDQDKLSFIDMSDGATLLKENDGKFAFGISECYNINSIKTSVCYIIATGLKYYESEF